MLIPAIITFWAISAPGGFLVGEVYNTKNNKEGDNEALPFACAAFPPLAAIIAMTVIAQTRG